MFSHFLILYNMVFPFLLINPKILNFQNQSNNNTLQKKNLKTYQYNSFFVQIPKTIQHQNFAKELKHC